MIRALTPDFRPDLAIVVDLGVAPTPNQGRGTARQMVQHVAFGGKLTPELQALLLRLHQNLCRFSTCFRLWRRAPYGLNSASLVSFITSPCDQMCFLK